jgi:ribosomal protein S18 acetylase RimI-like enzyme
MSIEPLLSQPPAPLELAPADVQQSLSLLQRRPLPGLVTPGRPEHAQAAAQLIVSTDEHLFKFCGGGTLDPWLELAQAEWCAIDGIYSHRFAKVLEIAGTVKALVLAFPSQAGAAALDWRMTNSRQTMAAQRWQELFDRFSQIGPILFAPAPEYSYYLQNIAVAPAFKGQGIGRALLDLVVEDARSAGCTSLTLDVDATTPAVTFYQTFGFITTRTVELPPLDMNPHLRMTMPLQPSAAR